MSLNTENEYKEIFYAEAFEQVSEINRILTVLENDFGSRESVKSLFRITHTLKGNATGMGYEQIAELAHVLEDFFASVRDARIILNEEIFGVVFKAADALMELVKAIREPRDVRFRGVKTRLEVLLKSGTEAVSEVAEVKGIVPDDDIQAVDIETDSGSVAERISDVVQVPVRKLDNLLNLVSELVIERDRISALGLQSNLQNELNRLSRISSDLQYSVMDVRLVQVGFLFNKFHRVVRDAAVREKKKVRLVLEGTETEIDRNVLNTISDSLIHLIRNCVGHGIELPEERISRGKKPEGTITLSATGGSDFVTVNVRDDGHGIDLQKVKKKALEKKLISQQDLDRLTNRDIMSLIFEPGFSTAEEITAISGRGVGMDAVKRALESIGGAVVVESFPGEGTVFCLTLPSSMSVKSTLLFEISKQTYAIPLAYTESVIALKKGVLRRGPASYVTMDKGKTLQILFLSHLLSVNTGSDSIEQWLATFDESHRFDVIVVSINGVLVGLVVDRLLQQKEIIEKPLMKPLDQISFLSGLTILGNGHVCLSLNIAGLLNGFGYHRRSA